MTLRPGARWLLGFVLAYLCLTVLFSFFGSAYVSMLVPMIRWGIENATSGILLRAIAVQGEILHVVFAPTLDQGLHTDPDVTVDGGIQIFYTAPIIALAVLAVWPGKQRAARLLAMLFALPLLACLPALHYPSLLMAPKFSGDGPHSLFWFWYFFLNNGGPQILALLFAWLAMATCDGVLRWAAGETRAGLQATSGGHGQGAPPTKPAKRSVAAPTTRKRRAGTRA